MASVEIIDAHKHMFRIYFVNPPLIRSHINLHIV